MKKPWDRLNEEPRPLVGDLKMKAGGVCSSIKSSSFHKESLKIERFQVQQFCKIIKCPNPTPPFFCSWKNVWSKVRACPSPHQPAGDVYVEERLEIMESRVQNTLVQNTLLSRYGILVSGCRWRGEVERLYGLYQLRIILKKSFLGGCKTSK